MPGPGGHHGGGPGGPGGGRGPGGPGGFGGPHGGPGGPGGFGGPHGGPGGPRGFGPGPRPPYRGYGHRPYRGGCLGCLMPVLGTIAVIVTALSFLIF